MQQNNLFRSGTFSKRVNRFKNSIFIEEEYSAFDFNNNLKSDNIEELEFTNFVSSKLSKKYITLKEICKKINNNEKEWDKLFVADEIAINTNSPRLDRLYNIISNVNNKKVIKSKLILKFKYIADSEIQFYINNENGILKLYLIDLYHIGIEATNRKTGRTDRKGIYKARKNLKFDIKEIKNELDNVEKNVI